MSFKRSKISIVGIILLFFFCLVFIQNFIYAKEFDLLSFRCIDDYAFQISLNNYHKNFYDTIFTMNDYGYGWIYWFPITILTFPAYWLQQFFEIEWLLIIIPRMYSLFFAIGCSYIMYKIVRHYTDNKWIIATALLLLPVFPTLSYFAGRFGTVCQVSFFSMLSIWLIIKNDILNKKNLRYALLAFACAIGTKMSAVAVAPMIVLLILERYSLKFNKKNISEWFKEGVFSFYVFVFALSPAIALAPFMWTTAKESVGMIIYFIKNVKGDISLKDNFIKGVMQATSFTQIYILLILGLIVLAILQLKGNKRSASNRDFICILLGYICGEIYLCSVVGNGCIYITIYSVSISFAIPLGLCILDRIPKCKYQKKIIAISCTMVLLFQCIYLIDRVENREPYNLLNYYQDYKGNGKRVNEAIHMKNILMETSEEKPFTYLIDASLPIFLSPISHNEISVYVNWGDLQEWSDNILNLEYIVLDKKIINKDHTKKELVRTGTFAGKYYKKVYDDEHAFVFKRQ